MPPTVDLLCHLQCKPLLRFLLTNLDKPSDIASYPLSGYFERRWEDDFIQMKTSSKRISHLWFSTVFQVYSDTMNIEIKSRVCCRHLTTVKKKNFTDRSFKISELM